MRLACNFQPSSDCEISALINHPGPGKIDLDCETGPRWLETEHSAAIMETFTRTIQLSPVTRLAGPISALRQPMSTNERPAMDLDSTGGRHQDRALHCTFWREVKVSDSDYHPLSDPQYKE